MSLIKIRRTDCIVAVFNDDDVLMDALKKSRAKGYKIIDVFTPFPVHGIEKALGIKRSNLGVAAFAFGCVGLLFGFALTGYTMTYDWPMDIGGKPIWPLLSFVPILFECTVLIASLGMVTTFFTVSKMAPGVIPVIYDKRATADRFVVLYEVDGRINEVRSNLNAWGVEEIRNDVHVDHNMPFPLPFKLK
jgi:hypothetical protein